MKLSYKGFFDRGRPVTKKSDRVALVSGANKGLGFAISRQLAGQGLTVVMTDCDVDKGQKSQAALASEGLNVVFFPMDVTDAKTIRLAREFVEKEFCRIDVLINNAGILIDGEKTGLDIDAETVQKTFRTNTLGHLLVSQEFIPLMKKNGYGRIVNLSSTLGSLSEMDGRYPSYRISKTALNAVTRILAAELKNTGILVNSVCPGWCRTDLAGPKAPRSPEKGAEMVMYLAMLPDNGPSGYFFRDKKKIAW